MNRQPYQTPPHWWSPRPSLGWTRFWRGPRQKRAADVHGLSDVHLAGIENLRGVLQQDCGVMICPNHANHADGFAMMAASDILRHPFYFMTAWQVFAMTHTVGRSVLRQHGCFSINREGHDVRAIRQSIRVLEETNDPLVIFPEGEVYHLNDRVMPFRRGAAKIAAIAADRGNRPIACLPCAIKYTYVDDPTEAIEVTLDNLEKSLDLRTSRKSGMVARLDAIFLRLLEENEERYLNRPSVGSRGQRVEYLIEYILSRLEHKFLGAPTDLTIPVRVKRLRQSAIEQIESTPVKHQYQLECTEAMDDLFLVMQLFSYPVDYLANQPSIERIAETVDKLEEDILGAEPATVRGMRSATITFGQPFFVFGSDRGQAQAEKITTRLETEVQHLLSPKHPICDLNDGPREVPLRPINPFFPTTDGPTNTMIPTP